MQIGVVFPQGLTKREASAEIDQMKYLNGLPARWIHAYVRQLRKRQSFTKPSVARRKEVIRAAYKLQMQSEEQ